MLLLNTEAGPEYVYSTYLPNEIAYLMAAWEE